MSIISPQEALLHERMRVALADPDEGIELLRENLTKFARIQAIKWLACCAGEVDVALEFYLLRPDPSRISDCIELYGPDRRKRAYRKEGPFAVAQVATRGPRDRTLRLTQVCVRGDSPGSAPHHEPPLRALAQVLAEAPV